MAFDIVSALLLLRAIYACYAIGLFRWWHPGPMFRRLSTHNVFNRFASRPMQRDVSGYYAIHGANDENDFTMDAPSAIEQQRAIRQRNRKARVSIRWTLMVLLLLVSIQFGLDLFKRRTVGVWVRLVRQLCVSHFCSCYVILVISGMFV